MAEEKNMSNEYLVKLDIQMDKINGILQKIEKAKEEIYWAYKELDELPTIHIVADNNNKSHCQPE